METKGLTDREVGELMLEGKFSSGSPRKGDAIPGTTVFNAKDETVENEAKD